MMKTAYIKNYGSCRKYNEKIEETIAYAERLFDIKGPFRGAF
jgi:hypothetical protein